MLKCPQPQYQSRNKILKAKGNTSNYGWKEPQWKCEQTQGLIKSKRVFVKVRHIIQVIKHPVRALCALLELLTMKPLFIIKSESPPYTCFKLLFSTTYITWLILYPYCTSVSLVKGVNLFINHMNKQSWQFSRYRIWFHHSSWLQNDSMQTHLSEFPKQTYSANHEQTTLMNWFF